MNIEKLKGADKMLQMTDVIKYRNEKAWLIISELLWIF